MKEAFSPFRLCCSCAVGFSPRGNSFGSFAAWDFFLFSFLPFRWSGEEGGVSGCTWCWVPGGLLPSRWISVQREGWECLWTFVCCVRARSRFSSSFGSWRSGSCSVAAESPCPLRFLGCLSPFLATCSTTGGIERDFGGPLPRDILPWFPIFGSRSTEG